MIKIFKTLVLAGVVIGAIGIASYNIMASDRVENLALEDYKAGQKDYKAGENQSAKDILPKKNQDGLQLSDFSLPIYSMAEAKDILSSDGKNISKLLQSTDKKLWFMMNEDEPEGIVVANDVRPIKNGWKKQK